MADSGTTLTTAHNAEQSALAAENCDEVGARGSLIIADRAVQRIAQAAALAVTGVAPAEKSTNTLNSVLGRAYPRVDCDISGNRVRAELDVVGVWPTPAPLLAGQVRDAVTEQLHQLAGLTVDAVDVTVAKIIRVHAAPRRRVQ